MTETERSFKTPPGPVWRTEPFRLFFPLGVLLGAVGVSHWILYATGIISEYSCVLHGAIQMQAFMTAFALGFLLTALPRRTQTAPPSVLELALLAAALGLTTAGALWEEWLVAEAGYGAQFVILLQFAVRRFLGRAAGRKPPAAFVLIPIGVLHGLLGAALIAASSRPGGGAEALGLGLLLVEQGVFLCFVAGVGSLILPLMAGAPPPRDLDASPRESRKALAYAAVGAVLFGSFLLEHWGWSRGGPLLRAVAVASSLGFGGGAGRLPAKPGLHRLLVWAAVWLMPAGLAASALWPDYRVPALHVLFIGGFSLMAFGVATHVTLSHLGAESEALTSPRAIAGLGGLFLLALVTRLAADLGDTYFEHLGWAAAFWLAGAGMWLAYLGPRLLSRGRDG